MNLNSGFPPPNKTAPVHHRYVGLFCYDAYWRKWDKVLGVYDGFYWLVEDVETKEVRKHCSALWADRFADQPFEV